jgi:hypothetical protein
MPQRHREGHGPIAARLPEREIPALRLRGFATQEAAKGFRRALRPTSSFRFEDGARKPLGGSGPVERTSSLNREALLSLPSAASVPAFQHQAGATGRDLQ